MTNKYLEKIALRLEAPLHKGNISMPSGYTTVFTGKDGIHRTPLGGMKNFVKKSPGKAALIGAAGLGAAAFGIKKIKEA
jgi:hypothetical protein